MTHPKRNALGRGLNALISTEEVVTEGSSSINEIPLAHIFPNPDQPRKEFDQEAMAELTASILSLGIITPITLQQESDDRYLIIAGERRYRAARQAGLDKIPAYVRTADKQTLLEMALTENLQREDLNTIEIALAYQFLVETYDLTQEAIARRVGKSRTAVTNYLRLLKLPAEIQMALKDHKIDMGHARAFLSVDSTLNQIQLFEETVTNNYSVRVVEEIAKQLNAQNIPAEKTSGTKTKNVSEFYLREEAQLASFFQSKVKLNCDEKGKGKITIPFRSRKELERMIELFNTLMQH